MKSTYNIFYSWQSDSPKDTNHIAIRQAVQEALNCIESEVEDINIKLDEATRGTSGSPNISNIIFTKILSSDIFICDITTINHNAEGYRRVPNPNVLIELGFAIATLGWERIILLFNKEHGNFPNDVPFDIIQNRITDFKITDKKDNGGKKQLLKSMEVAIKAIIEKNPLKPEDLREKTPEEKKRDIDIRNLELLLNTIHIPTFDDFIEKIPRKIIGNIFYFKDSFVSIFESNTFHIYDQDLLDKLTIFKDNWIKSLSFYQHYNPDYSNKNYNFYMIADTFQNGQAEKDYHTLVDIRSELENNFKDLLYFVRNHYIEIDIEEASKKAFESHKSYTETN